MAMAATMRMAMTQIVISGAVMLVSLPVCLRTPRCLRAFLTRGLSYPRSLLIPARTTPARTIPARTISSGR